MTITITHLDYQKKITTNIDMFLTKFDNVYTVLSTLPYTHNLT